MCCPSLLLQELSQRVLRAEAVACTPSSCARLTAPWGLLPFPTPHLGLHPQCPARGHRN